MFLYQYICYLSAELDLEAELEGKPHVVQDFWILVRS